MGLSQILHQYGSSSLLGHEQKLFTSFLHQSLKLINHKRLVIFLLLLQHKPQWYFPPWLESPLAPHIKNKSYGGKLSVLLVFRYLERGDPTLYYSLCVWSNVWYVHCYIHHPSITWRVLNSEPPPLWASHLFWPFLFVLFDLHVYDASLQCQQPFYKNPYAKDKRRDEMKGMRDLIPPPPL